MNMFLSLTLCMILAILVALGLFRLAEWGVKQLQVLRAQARAGAAAHQFLLQQQQRVPPSISKE
jgi:hypothetical protein